MAAGQREYQDVLDGLAEAGLDGIFTQTGGMNAALEIPLDGGTVLVTGADDTLPWNRAEHHGWTVALYSCQDDEPIRFLATEDSPVAALLELIGNVLLPG